ncbi:hypothetical protein IC582_004723 [Cucumis melo]
MSLYLIKREGKINGANERRMHCYVYLVILSRFETSHLPFIFTYFSLKFCDVGIFCGHN